jgi:hypothetical protein
MISIFRSPRLRPGDRYRFSQVRHAAHGTPVETAMIPAVPGEQTIFTGERIAPAKADTFRARGFADSLMAMTLLRTASFLASQLVAMAQRFHQIEHCSHHACRGIVEEPEAEIALAAEQAAQTVSCVTMIHAQSALAWTNCALAVLRQMLLLAKPREDCFA